MSEDVAQKSNLESPDPVEKLHDLEPGHKLVESWKTWAELTKRIPSIGANILSELSENVRGLSPTFKRLVRLVAVSAIILTPSQAQETSGTIEWLPEEIPSVVVMPDHLSVVAIGDSNTEGNVLPEGFNPWPSHLRDYLKELYEGIEVEVTNCGIGGTTLSHSEGSNPLMEQPRFEDCLDKSQADLAIVMLSTNDALTFQTPESVGEGFVELLDQFKQTGVNEVLLIVPPRIVAPYNTDNLEVGLEYQENDPNLTIDEYIKTLNELEIHDGMQILIAEPKIRGTSPGLYDGIHLDDDRQRSLAAEVAEMMPKVFSNRSRQR